MSFTHTVLAAALPFPADAPAVTGEGMVVVLTYPSAEVHARRVSDDVETLRAVYEHVVVESWSPAGDPMAVHLRYAPAPVAPRAVDVPQPIAPRSFAPVPASRSPRR